jgi:hypothetical protein
MSALARLSSAAGGVIVLLAGSAMIASAHTSSPAHAPQAQTTATNQTTWQGNGKDNLPCTGGTLHWIFTGGENGTFADLYIDGVFADAGEQKGASGKGAWHFYTPSTGVTNGPPRTNVYVTYDGAAGGNLVISHCEEGTTTSTTSTTSTVPTTSETTSTTETTTSTVPTTSETTSTSTVPTTSETTSTTETTATTTVPTITTDTAPTTSTTSTTTETTETTSTSTIPTTSETTSETVPTTATTTVPTITTDTAPTTSTTTTSTLPSTSTTTVPTITTDTAPTTSTTSSSTIPTTATTTSPGQTLPSESTRPSGVVPTAVEAGLESSSGGGNGGPNPLVVVGLLTGLALLIAGGWSVLRELRRVH